MADQPMTQPELHNAIVDMRGQLYAMEIMIARLYLVIAQGQADAQSVLDDVLRACLRDAENMDLIPPYNPDTAAEMKSRIKKRLRENFTSLTPQSSLVDRNLT